MDESFRISIEGCLNTYNFGDEVMDIIEREVLTRTNIILSAVAAIVSNDDWDRIQLAVEKARKFE